MKILNDLARIICLLELQTVVSKKVLTVSEAAKYLGLAEATLYSLTSQRLIPFSKPSGKKLFFDRDQLDSWALSNRVLTVDEIAGNAVDHKSNRKRG